MSNTPTSFHYAPMRQGYDTNSWRTLSGAPAVANSGRIVVDAGTGVDGAAIHYADILKGEVSFDINVPSAPAIGDTRYFGLAALNTGAYVRFAVVNGEFLCQTSDGTNTTNSSAITWDSNWTGANIDYKIRWEAGAVRFYINGSQVHISSDSSVPNGTLSLYLFDNSTSAMTVGDINTRGMQSFLMNPKTSDTNPTTSTGNLSVFQGVTVTEATTILIPTLVPSLSETVTVTDVITLYIESLYNPLNDTVTITENVSLTIV